MESFPLRYVSLSGRRPSVKALHEAKYGFAKDFAQIRSCRV